MEEVILRGHHILNFYDYVHDREDRGFSHRLILRLTAIGFRLTGQERSALYAEVYGINLFRDIFERRVKTIKLVATLDDLCLGPKRDASGSWCKNYNANNCSGYSLSLLDQLCIIEAGLNQEMVSNEEFVVKVHKSKGYLMQNLLLDYFAKTIGKADHLSEYDFPPNVLYEKLPEKCKKLCFSFLDKK